MEHALADLGLLDGVGGSFVCDNAGGVIVSSTPPALATDTMTNIGREVALAFGAMEAAARPLTRLEFTYDRWQLYARDAGLAFLFVVCVPGADMAMVRMTVDVIISRWTKDRGIEKRLKAGSPVQRDLVRLASLDDATAPSGRLIESLARGG